MNPAAVGIRKDENNFRSLAASPGVFARLLAIRRLGFFFST
jgi:hypothetical protein